MVHGLVDTEGMSIQSDISAVLESRHHSLSPSALVVIPFVAGPNLNSGINILKLRIHSPSIRVDRTRPFET